MFKFIIKLFAFFAKEIHHIRRQPGLLLSLILGPVLILLVFGLGYLSNPPDYDVILIWPQGLEEDADLDLLKVNIEKNFNVIDQYESEEKVREEFLNHKTEADVVVVIPEDIAYDLDSGNQATINILLNEIDPQQERFITNTFYQFFDEINKVLLENSIEELQAESGDTQSEISNVNNDLKALNSALNNDKVDDARNSIDSLRGSLAVLSSSGALDAYAETTGEAESEEIEDIDRDLEELDQILASGEVSENKEKINDMQNRLNSLENRLKEIENIPTSAIVAPITQNFNNVFGEPYNLSVFFSPRVLALVIQHIAITLGALTLVRETSRGTLEYFGVAPTSGSQILFGKYFAYFVTMAILSTLIIFAMIFFLEVPHIGSSFTIAGFIALYLFTNLSMGFLISAITKTENQAIQASMLFLLVSVFFSGFIIPLKNFRVFVRQLGMLLPIRHANIALTDMMLVGKSPDLIIWVALALLGIVSFAITAFLWTRQYRNLD